MIGDRRPRRIFDISPPVSPELAVWPGDTPASREVLLAIEAGASVTISTLHATVHLGAHADAPSHYGRDAPSIEARDVALYLGPCRVIHIPARPRSRIGPDDLPSSLDVERVLIRTGTFPDPGRFRDDFAGLEPAAVRRLHELGARLIGVDTPSVDLFSSQDLPAHRACLHLDVAILEGLILDAIPEGIYELIAPPLRLVGFDASPVRALLREYHPPEIVE